MVQGNGMDLSLFQFDYDMSFAVFFLNADKTIYGRYGSRSKKPEEAHSDISLEGLAASMKQVLGLHLQYPKNRHLLAGKTGPKPLVATPEKLPALSKFRSDLAFGDPKTVNQSCIHCHQIRDAERTYYFKAGKKLPRKILYPYPMPEVVGLVMDRKHTNRIQEVTEGSPAAKAGVKAGDQLTIANGQIITSLADVQWVLHQRENKDSFDLILKRGEESVTRSIPLLPGWRAKSDISWRTSSWALRRIATGGLVLQEASAEQRKKLGLAKNVMALRVEYVGQYGKHATGKRSGFKENDVIIAFDGKEQRWRETDLFAYVVDEKKKGQRIPVTVLRKEKHVKLMLPVQD